MANPRKFSEKIALHNQKQAEETAAFEAIIKEVTSATRAQGPSYPKQHLPISQNLGVYRGGSLPNVNQIGGGPGIDLQTALQHLDDIKHGRPNLVDRIHRERTRQVGPHRRFPVDKRADCSPYGSAYLSPPPDTSWRRMYRYLNGVSLSRTNSDSALHTSAMAPIDHIHSPQTPPGHRRVTEVAGHNMGDGVYWDPKKLVQSRPKSCEVPNINIYPSQEQDSGAPHIPISNNTGSLPDLTVLNFPSPMATPLDVDQDYNQQGSPVNLSPTNLNHMAMSPQQQQIAGQQSPGQRRRHTQGVPSPLVLSNSNQMRMPLSPPVGNMDPSSVSVDPRMRQQYLLYMHQQQQPRHRAPNSTVATPGAASVHPVYNNHHPRAHQQSQTSPHHQQQQQQQQQQPQQQQQQQQHSPHHGVPQVHITSCDHEQEQPTMTQYRNNVSEQGCQSPTSPLSQPSYSPAQSPGLPPATSLNNSPFAEAYFIQQQQQTNALQQQFEHFHMLQDSSANVSLESAMNVVSSAVYSNPTGTINLDSQDFHTQQQQQQFFRSLEMGLQQNQLMTQGGVGLSNGGQVGSPQPNTPQHLSPSANNKIPDIVLTGADDSLGRAPPDFAKDLGNAITGMSDSFDTDLFSTDEAFKEGLDPLDLDGLQMLTDPNMITDPATEDTFKLDRL